MYQNKHFRWLIMATCWKTLKCFHVLYQRHIYSESGDMTKFLFQSHCHCMSRAFGHQCSHQGPSACCPRACKTPLAGRTCSWRSLSYNEDAFWRFFKPRMETEASTTSTHEASTSHLLQTAIAQLRKLISNRQRPLRMEGATVFC